MTDSTVIIFPTVQFLISGAIVLFMLLKLTISQQDRCGLDCSFSVKLAPTEQSKFVQSSRIQENFYVEQIG